MDCFRVSVSLTCSYDLSKDTTSSFVGWNLEGARFEKFENDKRPK